MLEVATKSDASAMAQFMVEMALETENKKLDSNLVKRAVEYLIESDYGQTLVKKIEGQPVAALFLTYQNDEIWWISSVFVSKAYRGKGLFS
jgi:predicted GNAT family acetyltransferase